MGIFENIYKTLSLDAPGDATTKQTAMKRYRKYYDGDHDMQLSDKMKSLLRFKVDDTDTTDASGTDANWSINHIPTVVHTHSARLNADRYQVVTRTPEEDPTEIQLWVESLCDFNRFLVLQEEVHSSAYIDGKTYIMVGWDERNQLPTWTLNQEYDGEEGVFLIYSGKKIYGGCRVWKELYLEGKDIKLRKRADLYLPELFVIRRYWAKADSDDLQPFNDPATNQKSEEVWGTESEPLPMPIVPFFHRRGQSLLKNALPLQDSINRMLYSLVAAGESTGFPRDVVIGASPYEKDEEGNDIVTPVDPATTMVFGEEGVNPQENLIEVKRLESGDMSQLVNGIKYLALTLSTITNTPDPGFFDSNSLSGRGFMAREIGLVAQIKRAQKEFGVAWEQLIDVSWYIQSVYGSGQPPDYFMVKVDWNPIDLISNWEIVDNAVKIAQTGMASQRAILELLVPVTKWSKTQIDQIIAESQAESQLAATQAANALPDFSPSGDTTKTLGSKNNDNVNPQDQTASQKAA